MNKLTIFLPVRNYHCPISQGFGKPVSATTAKFYKELGLAGHNGIDFILNVGSEVLAAHDGELIRATTSDDNNYYWIVNRELKIKTFYCHLSEFKNFNKTVKAGELIGLSGGMPGAKGSGKYTTGPHLHFGLYSILGSGSYADYNNGYFGAVDPVPYLAEELVDWQLIKNPVDPMVFLMKNGYRWWLHDEDIFFKWFGRRVDEMDIKSVNLITQNYYKYAGLITK